MSDTHTFQDSRKKFTLTVKIEFLKKCEKPIEYDAYDLNNKFCMFKFLHNPAGPALIRHEDNYEEYWIDGKNLAHANPELNKKMKHTNKFNKKLEDL